jgi:hypothetical protein
VDGSSSVQYRLPMLDELMTGRIRVDCLDLAESPAEAG